MPRKEFDLIVIGSGPGGLRAAIQGAKLGKRVAIVERDRPGGSCVHTGTIPSKSLREAALTNTNNFAAALSRMRSIVKAEAKVVATQLARNGVQYFKGNAAFLSPQEISVGKDILHAPAIVIATGTRPLRHEEFPFGKRVHDSDSILNIKQLPSSLMVVGAGVIGCEYASIFARLGSKVTLVDRRKELLRSVDQEVISALKKEFSHLKVQVKLGCDLGKIHARATGLKVKLNGRAHTFHSALICMGRQPNTETLDLQKAQVKLDNRGYIEVDRSSFRSSTPSIYAVGDVIGPPGLAASSAEQGRIATCRIFSEPCPDFPASFPFGIYTIPEISSVGLQEEELKEKKIPYVVGRAPFFELARGLIVNDKNGFVKLLVHADTRHILGVHAIGMGASEFVHIGQAALAMKVPVDFLVENVFNYPTFAEAYKVAALHAVNQLKEAFRE